jgi:exodeoxyribonuclease V alpha subunit
MAASGNPLLPHGTARALIGGAPVDDIAAVFDQLRTATTGHDVSGEDLFVAEELVRLSSWLSPRQTRALCYLVVAVLIAGKQGSTRLPLGGGPHGVLGQLLTQLSNAAGNQEPVAPLLKDIDSLARGNYFGRLIGGPDESRPLIAASGCLYQNRFFAAEKQLVGRVTRRLEMPGRENGQINAATLVGTTGGPFELSNEQRDAVSLALSRSLTVIAGGPGTGKTAIAAAILRSAGALGIAARDMAIAAPTGKAAQRLGESMAPWLAGGELEPPAPTTVHRLLGYRPSGGFRHHENHPLGARLVVVDEASMIDLALMDRLLAALGSEATLVLLGDPDQLPSVDAGAVFRDLVISGDRAGSVGRYSSRLTQSFRMDPRDAQGRAIYELSRRVVDGDASCVAELASDSADKLRRTGARRVPAGEAELDALCQSWTNAHFGPEVMEPARTIFELEDGRLSDTDRQVVTALLERVEDVKVLTATRQNRFGSAAIAERIHGLIRVALGRGPSELGAGEPLLVTRNDYRRGLFNGDTGLVVRVRDGEGPPLTRVAFDGPGGARLFPLESLRGLVELGHAITVHRSQGSEYRHVLILVPDRPIPLLTRELVYTGITRARKSVTLVGPTKVYRAAIRRSAERFSGIVDRLARPS